MEKTLTGYPSIDKPWLKYYNENAEADANNIPENKTVWDVIEERLLKYKDIPAIEYFGRVITRPQFIDLVYTWARAFKALGIKENEVVPYYGPFFPDVGAMTFALNIIGACPYFLKLAISPEALAEETKDSRTAIVFNDMWGNVCTEFSKDRFEKIIIVSAVDAMPVTKKQIVSLLGKIKRNKNTPKIPRGEKYLRLEVAKKSSELFQGEVRVPFVPDRPAFITSSSGTTVGGVVKATVATNESTLSQLYMGDTSDIEFYPGDRILNHFPPTASTSLNVLFFLALFEGETIIMDPRVSENDFYKQVITMKPNVVLTTGSAWEAFFNRVNKEMDEGKTFDFSYSKGWMVGGEGSDSGKFLKWYEIMKKANAYHLVYSGYGLSELFSAVSAETAKARYDFSKPVMSVGIPYAGIVMGVFDSDGKEAPYNTRGELWIKSKSAMKEYYNKPELTTQTKVKNWIHTGDLAEIDENGFVYIWGRCKDTVRISDGTEIYLFDIANKIKEKDYIDDAIVLPMPTGDKRINLVTHLVWNGIPSEDQKKQYMEEMNSSLRSYLPEEIVICGYAEHETMLPYSPTTLKKDKNKLSKQTAGYRQIVNGKMKDISFTENQDGTYSLNQYNHYYTLDFAGELGNK